MRKQKKERKRELKLLQEQDQELCEVLCMPHHDIDGDSVPSVEELSQFRQHVATLRQTKVRCRPCASEGLFGFPMWTLQSFCFTGVSA